MDLERLDGVGCLEYDEENAVIEDAKLREQVELYNRRLREIEERNKATSRHLAGLVSSSGHSQFPSHHHLQSDLLLEVRYLDLLSDSPVKPHECSWNSSSWFLSSESSATFARRQIEEGGFFLTDYCWQCNLQYSATIYTSESHGNTALILVFNSTSIKYLQACQA